MQERWKNARIQRGKPRVYIQQFFELWLPEAEYLAILESAREGADLSDRFDDDAGMLVLEQFLADLDDGSQCDSVHVNQVEGQVQMMTVLSYPFKQATYDRLRAEFLAERLVTTGIESRNNDGDKG